MKVDDEELADGVSDHQVVYLEDELRECKKFLDERHEASPSGERRLSSRNIPKRIRNVVSLRDGGRCVFPGCNAKGHSLHHISRYVQGHYHDPRRIVTLCESHERLLHAGLIENEGDPPELAARHTAAHRKLSAEVERLVAVARDNQADIVPEDLQVFLRSWLMDHILTTDMEMKKYIGK